MPAYYPSSLRNNFSTKVDFVTTVFAEHVNSLQEEVTAIETVIGTTPTASSGWVGTFNTTTTNWPTLKARLNNIEFGLKGAVDGKIPTGGTTGQVLRKTSNADFAVGFSTLNMATDVTGILPVANGGTGVSSLGSGVVTFLQTPTSANLAAAVTNETGTGALVFGTNPEITPAAGTTTTATSGAGYMGMPQTAPGGNYQLATSDAGKHIYFSISGLTLTIPVNSLPVGTTVVVVNGNGVNTTITSASDTLRLANSTSTGSRFLASNGMATLLKITSNSWIISGNGVS